MILTKTKKIIKIFKPLSGNETQVKKTLNQFYLE